MRIIAALAAGAALLASPPAGAQNYAFSSIASSARQVYASCVSISRQQGIADPRMACACVTGYMGGALSDRDYEVAAVLLRVGEMTENGASQQAIEAEIIAFFERGFTEADVQRVSSAFDQISARGDTVCKQFESNAAV